MGGCLAGWLGGRDLFEHPIFRKLKFWVGTQKIEISSPRPPRNCPRYLPRSILNVFNRSPTLAGLMESHGVSWSHMQCDAVGCTVMRVHESPWGYMYPWRYMYPWGYMYPRGYMYPGIHVPLGRHVPPGVHVSPGMHVSLGIHVSRGYMYPRRYMYPQGYMYPRGYMYPSASHCIPVHHTE